LTTHLNGLGAAYIQNGSGLNSYESHPPPVASRDVPATSSAPTTASMQLTSAFAVLAEDGSRLLTPGVWKAELTYRQRGSE